MRGVKKIKKRTVHHVTGGAADVNENLNSGSDVNASGSSSNAGSGNTGQKSKKPSRGSSSDEPTDNNVGSDSAGTQQSDNGNAPGNSPSGNSGNNSSSSNPDESDEKDNEQTDDSGEPDEESADDSDEEGPDEETDEENEDAESDLDEDGIDDVDADDGTNADGEGADGAESAEGQDSQNGDQNGEQGQNQQNGESSGSDNGGQKDGKSGSDKDKKDDKTSDSDKDKKDDKSDDGKSDDKKDGDKKSDDKKDGDKKDDKKSGSLEDKAKEKALEKAGPGGKAASKLMKLKERIMKLVLAAKVLFYALIAALAAQLIMWLVALISQIVQMVIQLIAALQGVFAVILQVVLVAALTAVFGIVGLLVGLVIVVAINAANDVSTYDATQATIYHACFNEYDAAYRGLFGGALDGEGGSAQAYSILYNWDVDYTNSDIDLEGVLDTAQYVRSFFRTYGLTDTQAAAVCGVLYTSGQLDPTYIEPIDNDKGDAQWYQTPSESESKGWIAERDFILKTIADEESSYPVPNSNTETEMPSTFYGSNDTIYRVGIGIGRWRDTATKDAVTNLTGVLTDDDNTRLREFAKEINAEALKVNEAIEAGQTWQNDLNIEADNRWRVIYGDNGATEGRVDGDANNTYDTYSFIGAPTVKNNYRTFVDIDVQLPWNEASYTGQASNVAGYQNADANAVNTNSNYSTKYMYDAAKLELDAKYSAMNDAFIALQAYYTSTYQTNLSAAENFVGSTRIFDITGIPSISAYDSLTNASVYPSMVFNSATATSALERAQVGYDQVDTSTFDAYKNAISASDYSGLTLTYGNFSNPNTGWFGNLGINADGSQGIGSNIITQQKYVWNTYQMWEKWAGKKDSDAGRIDSPYGFGNYDASYVGTTWRPENTTWRILKPDGISNLNSYTYRAIKSEISYQAGANSGNYKYNLTPTAADGGLLYINDYQAKINTIVSPTIHWGTWNGSTWTNWYRPPGTEVQWFTAKVDDMFTGVSRYLIVNEGYTQSIVYGGNGYNKDYWYDHWGYWNDIAIFTLHGGYQWGKPHIFYDAVGNTDAGNTFTNWLLLVGNGDMIADDVKENWGWQLCYDIQAVTDEYWLWSDGWNNKNAADLSGTDNTQTRVNTLRQNVESFVKTNAAADITSFRIITDNYSASYTELLRLQSVLTDAITAWEEAADWYNDCYRVYANSLRDYYEADEDAYQANRRYIEDEVRDLIGGNQGDYYTDYAKQYVLTDGFTDIWGDYQGNYFNLWKKYIYGVDETMIPDDGQYIHWYDLDVQLLFIVSDPEFAETLQNWDGNESRGIIEDVEFFMKDVLHQSSGQMKVAQNTAYAFYYLFQYGSPYNENIKAAAKENAASEIVDAWVAAGIWDPYAMDNVYGYTLLQAADDAYRRSKVNTMGMLANSCRYVDTIDNSSFAKASLLLLDPTCGSLSGYSTKASDLYWVVCDGVYSDFPFHGLAMETYDSSSTEYMEWFGDPSRWFYTSAAWSGADTNLYPEYNLHDDDFSTWFLNYVRVNSVDSMPDDNQNQRQEYTESETINGTTVDRDYLQNQNDSYKWARINVTWTDGKWKDVLQEGDVIINSSGTEFYIWYGERLVKEVYPDLDYTVTDENGVETDVSGDPLVVGHCANTYHTPTLWSLSWFEEKVVANSGEMEVYRIVNPDNDTTYRNVGWDYMTELQFSEEDYANIN